MTVWLKQGVSFALDVNQMQILVMMRMVIYQPTGSIKLNTE